MGKPKEPTKYYVSHWERQPEQAEIKPTLEPAVLLTSEPNRAGRLDVVLTGRQRQRHVSIPLSSIFTEQEVMDALNDPSVEDSISIDNVDEVPKFGEEASRLAQVATLRAATSDPAHS